MNVSHKKIGLAMLALAGGLWSTASLADGRGPMPMMGPMMGGKMALMQPFDFAAADANKDGKVSAEEFAAYRAAQVGGIDTDKDGKISADELAVMNLKAMEAMAKARADRMVKALDVDGDGKLSAAELLAAPMPPDVFAMADANKDGVLDAKEAAAMAEHRQERWGDHREGRMGDHDGDHGGKPHGKRPLPMPQGDAPDAPAPGSDGSN